ncbi:hypothetical protein N9242_00930 [Vicingaceae bacterium]|nr:hypothetical protein [Vicingaceae bacterium]
MGIISLGSERIAVSFDELSININGASYENITFIVRLLTYDELVRVNSINTDDPVVNLIIEEDIFNITLYDVVGLGKDIDINEIEAGVISTISSAIMNSSNFYFSDPQAAIVKEEKESTLFNQMQLIVAKNYNILFKDIIKMPIDELVRKFALFQTTFPDQALEMKKEE